MSSEEEEYNVEKVVSKRLHGKVTQYEVKWEGYDETTWEPAKNLSGTLVEDFEAAQKAEGSASDFAAKSTSPAAAKRASKQGAAAKKPKAEKKVKVDGDLKGNHKYKDADGRLDRKKNGYYTLKGTWESSGQARKAHSGKFS